MKKLILLLLVFSFFGCKVTQTTSEVDEKIKNDLTTKVDSSRVVASTDRTISIDTSNMVIEIYDEFFAEPDSTGFIPIIQKRKTVIHKEGKKTVFTNIQALDATKYTAEVKDKGETKKSVLNQSKEEIKTPFPFKIVFISIGILIFVAGLLFIKKYFL